MSFIGKLTTEEQNVVKELKNRTLNHVTPKTLEDPYLFYRFSKARNFNLKQAESMLRKHIVWRHEMGTDTLLTEYEAPEVLKKYIPVNKIGFDKEGSPVRYVSVSGADVVGVFKSSNKTDVLKFWFQAHEKDMSLLERQSVKFGRPVTQVVYIYDFKKLSFATATHKQAIDLLITAITMYQDNYPERVKSIYLINTSIYFSILFSVLKVFIASGLMEKITLFGSDGWKDVLLQIIDPDQLPAFLGGKKTDPDGNPLCNTFICHGGVIPKHYYVNSSKRKLYREAGVQKLSVTPFSSTKLTFHVTVPDSMLEWEFETKCNDIGFGVYFKDNFYNESKPIELIPKQRIDTSTEPEVGMYKCEKVGTYIITFDNSYSWIHSKDVYYKAAIVPPSNEEMR